MVKPIILAVDDELQVLNTVIRDLRAYFGEGYRLIKAESGAEALQAIHELKRRNEPVALFLVDQRMPEMSGTEFLIEALKFYPDARKVLLTAYADTEAAILSINEIGLDHYLLKPWDPPDERLYPVLDDLLTDWHMKVDLPYDGIRVAGTLWSPTSHMVKDFLTRNLIPYQWLDIEQDSTARALVDSVVQGRPRLPVVFFPDGDALVEPDNLTLAMKVGMQTQASQPFYEMIIIGGGPAGLGAAVYGGSEGLRTILIEKEATGGQAGTSSRIENYLGFPDGLSGADLTERAVQQARRFGVEIVTAQEVTGVRVEDSYRFVMLGDGTELSCQSLLIATGVTRRELTVPGVERLNGAGIFYGATLSEAAFCAGQDVFIVGGANSAGQAAMFFSRYARSVTILVRDESLIKRMSHYLVHQIEGVENIRVLTQTQIAEAHGAQRLEALTLEQIETGETETIPASAMFIFIGAVPHTELVAGIVERNEAGFILTGPDLRRDGRLPKNWTLKRDPYYLETSVPGIFAAGDVRQGSVKRVASAVGEGAVAVTLIHQYLRTV